MHIRVFRAALTTIAFCFMALPAFAADPQHPYMWWTREEAARIRKLIETEPWAKEAYAREGNALVKYGIMGDKAAGEAEKAKLLADFSADKVATGGNAYRYDIVYDLLNDEQRQKIKAAFIAACDGASLTRMGQQGKLLRWNWLPNLNYASYSRMHVIAAATGDEAFIRKWFAGPHAIKWYMDEYLSDLGFYNEEFSKMYNTPQGLIDWCWAMQRAGLDELGWGYKGRQGATMRGHIDSLLRIGYPRMDLGNGKYFYPRLTIGDTRGGLFGMQHSLMRRREGSARGDWYVELLEIAHAKWPNDRYGYFLAQVPQPGFERYQMPLRFGVAPIDPKAGKPPAAPSGVYPGRGLIMLRAEEGPEYWESPAPAVGMRLATPYAHHVQDSFCLTGFYAFNRAIFVNHAHSTNYTGVDPGYSNSIRSHSAVIVDGREPNSLLEPVETRHEFSPRVKFAAARAKGIYPGVDQTRALMLTREYLLDVSHLASDHARDYLWQVHTHGHACPDRPSVWTPSRDLMGRLPDLGNEQSCATDEAWSVTAVQSSAGANRDYTTLGESWFKRRVGVRTTMLGEKGTRAYTAWAPVVPDTSGQWRGRNRFAYGEDEPAGTAIVATRKSAKTTFVAVHEPFEGVSRLDRVRRIAQTPGAVLLEIATPAVAKADPRRDAAFTDYLMVKLEDPEKPATLGQGSLQFTFANYAYVRHTDAGIVASGDLRAMRVPLGDAIGCPVDLNGKQAASRIDNGCVVVGDPPAGPPAPPDRAQRASMVIAARWQPPTGLCVPAGGKGTITLKLRNDGVASVGKVELVGTRNLVVLPSTIDLGRVLPGGGLEVPVTIDASKAPANELAEVFLKSSDADVEVQRAVLPVANGVCFTRQQIGQEFCETIYSPRYIAKVWYMDSGAPTELFDPQGFRRHDSSGASYPMLLQPADAEKKRIELTRVPKFAYFIPIFIDVPNQPRQLYDAGRHAHGTQTILEEWYTEDWMLFKYRGGQNAATQEIAFNFFPDGRTNGMERTIIGRSWEAAAEKSPGKTIVVDDQGKMHELTAPKPHGKLAWPKLAAVTAIFARLDGYEYGQATFYPANSKPQGQQVFHPSDKPVGFTFCTEKEFPELVKKWRENTPSGEADPKDAARYHGAFGASPVHSE